MKKKKKKKMVDDKISQDKLSKLHAKLAARY